MAASAAFEVVVEQAWDVVDDDGTPDVSFDEFWGDDTDSERGWGGGAHDDYEAVDADGSGLPDGEYWRRGLERGLEGEGNEGGDEGEAGAYEDDEGGSEVYPAGSLSWHDVHFNYGGAPEARREGRIGDRDYWED